MNDCPDDLTALLADDHGGLFQLTPPESVADPCRRALAHARRRAKVATRQAASDAALRACLPAIPEPGMSYHVISSGDVDAMSYLRWLIDAVGRADYALVSTWCMAMPDVQQLAGWLQDGRIGWLDVYVGEIFLSQYPGEHAELARSVRRHGRGRVAMFRCHAKVMLVAGGGRFFTVESSANVNTNPRAEQTAVHDDPGLFAHYKRWFDGVRSVLRDFDDWRPAPILHPL